MAGQLTSSPDSWFVRLKTLINHRDNVWTQVSAAKREITFLSDWAQTSINGDLASLPSVPYSANCYLTLYTALEAGSG